LRHNRGSKHDTASSHPLHTHLVFRVAAALAHVPVAAAADSSLGGAESGGEQT
jgi:hypothetical protein